MISKNGEVHNLQVCFQTSNYICYKMAPHLNKINALQQYSLFLAYSRHTNSKMRSLVASYMLSMIFDVWSFTKICEHTAASLEFNSNGH
jgi:hypothetical protein